MGNQNGGDFLGGVPRYCFNNQNPCEMGAAGNRAELEQMTPSSRVQPPPLQMVAEDISPKRQVGDGAANERPQLTPEQEARLGVVMAREALGGGHLTDQRHLGEMPDYRPRDQTVVRAYYAE